MEDNYNYPYDSDETARQYKKPRYSSNERNPPPPPPPSQLFYKTRLCGKYEQRCCPYGDRCTFAHGADDLRSAPPNWQEILKNQQPMQGGEKKNYNSAVVNNNTKPYGICWKFNMGEECTYGDKCIYKHVRPDQSTPSIVNHNTLEEPRHRGDLMNYKVGGRTEPVGVPSINPLLRDDDDDDEYQGVLLERKREPRWVQDGKLTSYFKMTDHLKISRIYGDWI